MSAEVMRLQKGTSNIDFLLLVLNSINLKGKSRPMLRLLCQILAREICCLLRPVETQPSMDAPLRPEEVRDFWNLERLLILVLSQV